MNNLVSYATNPIKTKGRLYSESPTPYRNEFQRDKDRIIHSNAFRRLEYKTQVFVNHEGDHYRNRLTHSIEVASIARSLAYALNISEDLAECIALAHDLGHTPFGHAGEEALNNCMKDYGGFCHNAHAIKILTSLELRYARYSGLNLTWEVLDGIAKHNGPLLNPPEAIATYNKLNDLDLTKYTSLEGQIAAYADDIAYHGHDLEDGIRANLFNIADLEELDFLQKYIKKITDTFPKLHKHKMIYEIIRDFTHHVINDLLDTTRKNISTHNISSSEDIRNVGMQIVSFSEPWQEQINLIKAFLFKRVYRNHRVTSVTYKCKQVVNKLFSIYMESPGCLPDEWQERIVDNNDSIKARVVSDYIAGMTDRYAIREYESFSNITFSNF